MKHASPILAALAALFLPASAGAQDRVLDVANRAIMSSCQVERWQYNVSRSAREVRVELSPTMKADSQACIYKLLDSMNLKVAGRASR